MELDPRKDSEVQKSIIPKQPKTQCEKAILSYEGKQYQIPVLKGTIGDYLLDIRGLHSSTGFTTYDPGFTCTASCMSGITYINGDQGELMYRGYKIEELAQHSTYVQSCYLLLYGQLPSKTQLSKFQQAIIGEMILNQKMVQFYKGFKSQAHPMAIMVGVVGALSAFLQSDYDLNKQQDRQQLTIKMIAKMPTLAAYAYRTSMGLPVVRPKRQFGYMKNFLYMMFSNPMSDQFQIADQILRALQVIWICHADHEQNASTSTVRIAGSSFANPFACVAAGIGSLWGPYHGGANEAVLTMLEKIHDQNISIQTIFQRAKDKHSNFRLMGFGHRVYKNFDPRAKIMQKMCYEVLKIIDDEQTRPLLDLAISLQKAALSDQYFIKRKLYPNVDFYTGIVYKAIGIPKDMFTVLFAVSRSAGWMSQWSEMMSQHINKLTRPRQLYVGQKEREFKDLKTRKQNQNSRVKQITKICKLTRLMKL